MAPVESSVPQVLDLLSRVANLAYRYVDRAQRGAHGAWPRHAAEVRALRDIKGALDALDDAPLKRAGTRASGNTAVTPMDVYLVVLVERLRKVLAVEKGSTSPAVLAEARLAPWRELGLPLGDAQARMVTAMPAGMDALERDEAVYALVQHLYGRSRRTLEAARAAVADVLLLDRKGAPRRRITMADVLQAATPRERVDLAIRHHVVGVDVLPEELLHFVARGACGMGDVGVAMAALSWLRRAYVEEPPDARLGDAFRDVEKAFGAFLEVREELLEARPDDGPMHDLAAERARQDAEGRLWRNMEAGSGAGPRFAAAEVVKRAGAKARGKGARNGTRGPRKRRL